jgi:hypothetical protein
MPGSHKRVGKKEKTVCCFFPMAYSLTLMMETIYSSETSINFNIPEHSKLHSHCGKYLKANFMPI